MKTRSGGIRAQLIAKATAEVDAARRKREAWIKSWPYRLHARAIAKNGRIGIVPRPRVMPAELKCSGCKITKPASEFYKNKDRPTLLRSECKACHKERYAYTGERGTKGSRSRGRVGAKVTARRTGSEPKALS